MYNYIPKKSMPLEINMEHNHVGLEDRVPF